jgi:Icc-related predicted phosphoesterase
MNIYYLNDSGIELEGIKFWGSPVQPEFFNWAFNKRRGHEIKRHWDMIPNDIDVLITHGGPQNILDANANNQNCGCRDLLEAVMAIQPKVHCFGHIHESYGIEEVNDTTFINASIMNGKYESVNKPIEFLLA